MFEFRTVREQFGDYLDDTYWRGHFDKKRAFWRFLQNYRYNKYPNRRIRTYYNDPKHIGDRSIFRESPIFRALYLQTIHFRSIAVRRLNPAVSCTRIDPETESLAYQYKVQQELQTRAGL